MRNLLLTLVAATLSLPTFARDIQYTYEGQTLTYTVLDEDAKTVETKPGDSSTSENDVSGKLVIPSEIKDGDIIYTVTSIGQSTFSECSDLTSVIIPESVISISAYAFYRCTRLTSVSLPKSVTSIGNEAFRGCSRLTSVIIPKSVTSIGTGAFQNCIGLTSVIIPESVTSISNFTFQGCSSLISVSIPESVTSIGNWAFSGCVPLATVILPMNIETLGGAAFANCSNIKEVVYNGSTPVESIEDVFDSKVYEDATLYVPDNSASLFRTVSPWKFFNNIIENGYNGIEDMVADFDTDAPCEIYHFNGVKAADSADNLPAGIYIRKSNGKSEKFIVR
ncbi:MAG: leucine-rich repeat domain-containing protein [Muribaculaceae bacterium]|nr:leucine-rich repeat domain-containing protein [Muribaculaceae bacterium]MDE7080872.1 leucine-rich repeat domain-containing protein [Muribaculaceae bacterium]